MQRKPLARVGKMYSTLNVLSTCLLTVVQTCACPHLSIHLMRVTMCFRVLLQVDFPPLQKRFETCPALGIDPD